MSFEKGKGSSSDTRRAAWRVRGGAVSGSPEQPHHTAYCYMDKTLIFANLCNFFHFYLLRTIAKMCHDIGRCNRMAYN